MNSTNTCSVSQEFKVCAGRDCRQTGIHELGIKYIHRKGWFCDSCRSILLEQNLIEGERESEVTNR
jgi:hypothetical protein